MRANGSKEVTVKAERQGKVKSYTLQPEYDKEAKRPLIGITPKFEKVEMSLIASLKRALAIQNLLSRPWLMAWRRL